MVGSSRTGGKRRKTEPAGQVSLKKPGRKTITEPFQIGALIDRSGRRLSALKALPPLLAWHAVLFEAGPMSRW